MRVEKWDYFVPWNRAFTVAKSPLQHEERQLRMLLDRTPMWPLRKMREVLDVSSCLVSLAEREVVDFRDVTIDRGASDVDMAYLQPFGHGGMSSSEIFRSKEYCVRAYFSDEEWHRSVRRVFRMEHMADADHVSLDGGNWFSYTGHRGWVVDVVSGRVLSCAQPSTNVCKFVVPKGLRSIDGSEVVICLF